MKCDQIQSLLEAFADGELGRGQDWRVRRHLAACPACAAELAETQQLNSRVRAWRDVTAPASLQSQIAAVLPPAAPFTARRPFPVRRFGVGLAGMAVVTAAFFWLLPGQPGRPTIAFADVEEAMQQVQIVSYDMNSHVYDVQGRVVPGVLSFSFRNWLRRIPAASAQYDAIMHEWKLEDVRGTVSYSQTLDKYLEEPATGNIEQTVNKYMRRLTQPPADEAPDPLHHKDYLLQPWQCQETTLEGRSCLAFTSELDRTTVNGDVTGESTHATIWVDGQTLHVVRIEFVGDPTQNVAPNGNKGVVERTVFDNFHYNETPPPGVFDWSPPAGAKVEGHW